MIGNRILGSWHNTDSTVYLSKLPEDGEYKRFIGNCQPLIDWLKGIGAQEIMGGIIKINSAIYYANKNAFMRKYKALGLRWEGIEEPNQFEGYHFFGADMDSHKRLEEQLKDMSDYWGVIWK